MSNDMNDDLDVLLRELLDEPVPDDGFCDRVMDRLPARRHRNRWPMAVGIFAGVALCWFTLWSAPIAYSGWHDWLSGKPSASTLALFISMLSMAIFATAWTIAEADDRSGRSMGNPAHMRVPGIG